jgi:hypothetical protein
MDRLSNAQVGSALERVAELLESQAANPYRVQAYRTAAASVRRCAVPLDVVLAGRREAGLREVLNVGPSLASVIRELLETGHLALLQRLEGQVSPEDLFMTIPGMGAALARRAHALLHLETLEDLEAAAVDGRLEHLPGFGPRRALLVREAVGARLAGMGRRWGRPTEPAEPGLVKPPEASLLLAIDAEYLQQADAGELPRISPRRFNPHHERWLPVWHVDRDGWSFTAMFSNTERAHALGMTRAWVVIYFERDGAQGQATVVTASKGPLAGRRVVRGREAESLLHYAMRVPPPAVEAQPAAG